jgi:hypothetical protein
VAQSDICELRLLLLVRNNVVKPIRQEHVLPPQTVHQSAKTEKTCEAESYQHDYLERPKSHTKGLMFLDNERLISKGDHLFRFLVADLGDDP